MGKRNVNGLSRKQVLNIRAAAEHATSIGQPLNSFVTIHWVMTASYGGKPSKGLAKFRARQRAWLARRGHELTHAWVHECGRSEEVHTHIALHVPRQFQADHALMLDQWLGSVCDGTALIKDIYHLKGLTNYFCKGVIDRKTAEEFGVRQEVQGEIHYKRSGFSQNLGPAARRRWEEELSAAFSVAAE